MHRLLGTITTGGAGESRNSHTTAVPFAIPPGARKLELLTADSGVTFRAGPDNSDWDPYAPAAYSPPFSPQSSLTADANDSPLSAGFARTIELNHYGAPHVVACQGGTAAAIKVFVRD